MNKKGFTLIELISTIIILGILALIVFPTVLSSIGKSKEDLKNDNKTLTISGAKNYVSDHQNDFKSNGTVYCLSLKTLYDNGYINTVVGIDTEDDVTLITDVVKVYYTSSAFKYEYVLKTDCSGQSI